MQQNPPKNMVPDVSERLHLVVDRMLEPFGKAGVRNRATTLSPDPFDTTKPNQHDSKAEFQRELDVVAGSLARLDEALDLLGSSEEDVEHYAMLRRLVPIIDQKLRRGAPRGGLADSTELIRKNVAEVGGYTGSYFVILDFSFALTERYQELKDQEEKFWNINHRAPDYYARTIALRLAKLFAREVGQRPTYGTAAIGDHPSTAYGRALEQVFEILEIKQKVRTHAKWAIKQITDEDITPLPVNSLSAMMGLSHSRPPTDNVKRVAQALLDKRSTD
ncbi:hypothetical protein [uncultured Roseobacter sp.]|uniref:hypothetical protein n=1 Tax=uncultured Roseobacter sp. TaxID=114847 RepID=UPI00260215B0|nr:hypothetical protein [uncultured Roseobacter sp.]